MLNLKYTIIGLLLASSTTTFCTYNNSTKIQSKVTTEPVNFLESAEKILKTSDNSLVYEYNEDINYSMYTNRMIDTCLIAGALYQDFKSNTIMPNTDKYDLYIKAKQHFLPYRDHEFIKQFGKYMDGDDVRGDVIGILLSCSNSPELKPIYKFQETYMNDIFTSQKDIDEFLNGLRKFYTDTKAEEFFNENSEAYTHMGKYIQDNIKNTNIVDLIKDSEKYVGNKNKYYPNVNIRYQTIMTLFRPFMASFFSIKSNDSIIFITFQSPNDYSRDPEKFDIMQTVSTSIHEILHNFINTPVANNNNLIMNLASFKDKNNYASKMYQDMPWNRIVDENFVRAVQGRIYKNRFGEERAMGEVMTKEIKFGGFKHLKSVYNKLEEYENERDKYPTMDDFTPELIKELLKSY